MTSPIRTGLVSCLFIFAGIFSSAAQSLPSSELYHQLLRLQETTRVLYVAAHPDDENTRLIAYLSNELHQEVAYLSLTRGDGGQNLIGKQLGIGLGQIRTQELLKARETDGGRQYFTRATDFGYSKNPDETLSNWSKEEILGDVIWVIRTFQPDVIITRFNTIPGVTHGHHTTSAILAEEAFALAGDPEAYPEQLEFVEIWQPKRIFWNAYNWGSSFNPDENEQYDVFPVGSFNPILGQTYSQIAADSRTMHKSQGFGDTPDVGEAEDFIQFLKGEAFTDSAFEGVSDRWTQLSGGEEVQKLLAQSIASFDFKAPKNNVDNLLKVKAKMAEIEGKQAWLLDKRKELDELIVHLMGIEIEVNAESELISPGESFGVEFIFNNPEELEAKEVKLTMFGRNLDVSPSSSAANVPIKKRVVVSLPADYDYSQPYWLQYPSDGAMYEVKDQLLIGTAFNAPNVSGEVSFQLNDSEFTFQVPVRYKFNDRVKGEVQQPLAVVPQVDLGVSNQTVFLLSGKEPEVIITVTFQNQMLDGSLSFDGLNVDQYKILNVRDVPDQKQRIYEVALVSDALESTEAVAQYQTVNGSKYSLSKERISYDHIPNLTYFQEARLNLIKADWTLSGSKIAYVPGAGDDVPQVLEALGYEVTTIGEGDYSVENLQQYQAVIVGIRAYNTNQTLAANQQILMGYVRSGGNVIVQYNTSSGLLTNQLGPYEFSLSRVRVAVEGSPVQADWDHPLMAGPNKMTAKDFDGWVQERGLYFVSDVSAQYDQPITMNEPNEAPSKGSLIYAKYGDGTFIYSGISFFRQLPAGVPGATKLFVNMIEQ